MATNADQRKRRQTRISVVSEECHQAVVFCPLAVDVGPPRIKTVQNTSSTSLFVSWDAPEGHSSEAISGYTLTCTRWFKFVEFGRKTILEVAGNVTAVEVTHLAKFASYCVQISAVTAIGTGNASDCKFGRTDEDGKQCTLNLIYSLVVEVVLLFFLCSFFCS